MNSEYLFWIVMVTISLIVVCCFVEFVLNTYRKQRTNDFEEIRLEGVKLKIDLANTPIDDLIGMSNKEHGVITVINAKPDVEPKP